MIETWNSFWFGGDRSFDLCVARLVILGYFVFNNFTYRTLDLVAWQRTMLHFKKNWKRPFLLEAINFPYLDIRVGTALVYFYRTLLITAFAGFFTQTSCALALIIGLYVLSFRHGLKISHPFLPIHFVLLGFVFSPCGAQLSVDSILFPKVLDASAISAASWGLQFIRATISIAIFATGFAKIRHLGFNKGFVKKGGLATLLRLHDFPYFYTYRLVPVGRILHRFPVIEKLLSLSVILIELAFPIALFDPYARAGLVPGFILCILGFRIFQGPLFDFFIVTLIGSFAPWALIFK